MSPGSKKNAAPDPAADDAAQTPKAPKAAKTARAPRAAKASPKTAETKKKSKAATGTTAPRRRKKAESAATPAPVLLDLDSALTPKQSNTVLRTAIIVSVVFHLALLTIKFTDPEAINDFFQRSSLEVVLINAQSEEAPTNPQVRAQYDYAGGGDSEEKVYATSSETHSEVFSAGDSFDEIQAELNAAREESMRLLNQVKAQYAQLPPIDPSWGENDPRRRAEEERRRQLSNTIAAIEQRIQEENARPRRMYIGPAARSDAQAMYYDMVRQKIEQRGTESFPQYAGLPLYGSLLMEVVVSPKGQMVSASVLQSSGNAVLDRQAQAIALKAGPFSAAPPELLRVEQNVEFVFVMRFNFLNEGKLTTELMERVNPQ